LLNFVTKQIIWLRFADVSTAIRTARDVTVDEVSHGCSMVAETHRLAFGGKLLQNGLQGGRNPMSSMRSARRERRCWHAKDRLCALQIVAETTGVAITTRPRLDIINCFARSDHHYNGSVDAHASASCLNAALSGWQVRVWAEDETLILCCGNAARASITGIATPEFAVPVCAVATTSRLP